ncbi:MAG: hypothetical protein ACJ751_19730 [Niastella sp.]|uniref:hypothetical protein n=1 Tax=Niastella sp. TaxID=1869183 RepID=UPI00389A8113
MKQVFSVLSVASVAFFTLFLSTTNVSCKKGDTGPKGDTGVANAMYSKWTNVAFSGAILQSGDTVALGTITAPAITKDILNKGSVHVYLNLNGADTTNPTVVQLPYVDPITYSTVSIQLTVGKIYLIGNDDFSGYYRYFILPGGVNVGRTQTIDWNNYGEVKKIFGLTN